MYKTSDLSEKLQQKNIATADYAGKRVLIRTCLNVAMGKDGSIADATRIDESVPTLKLLGEKAARVVMMAHLGRPTTAREAEFSLEPIRVELEKRLGTKVEMLSDEAAIEDLANAGTGEQKYYLIENIRYFAGEESKDTNIRLEFAKKLAKLGEMYVNDAFADYREAASTYEIATVLPSYLGPVFVREVEAVSYFANPERPFIGILGGAKLSEKLDALSALLQEADQVLVGGAMAYTLLQSSGVGIGKSLVEADKLEVAKQIMNQYRDKLVLPVDHVVVSEFSAQAATETTDGVEIPADKIAVDIGPKTQALFQEKIKAGKALLWNGPMGVFEWETTAVGTQNVGTEIVNNSAAYKFAGGGDSIAAINKFGLQGFSHISTGGGAMLAFVSYDKFPTLDVILNN